LYFSERHIFTVGGPLADSNELTFRSKEEEKKGKKKTACELSELFPETNLFIRWRNCFNVLWHIWIKLHLDKMASSSSAKFRPSPDFVSRYLQQQ